MVVTSSFAAFTVYDMMVSSGHYDGTAYYDIAFFWYSASKNTYDIWNLYCELIGFRGHIFFMNFQAEPTVWFGIRADKS